MTVSLVLGNVLLNWYSPTIEVMIGPSVGSEGKMEGIVSIGYNINTVITM